MKLNLRPPRAEEWPICRMLLPETFSDVGSRQYLLCMTEEAPQVVAAASFRQVGDEITHLRLHVVARFRRLGVASHIVECLAGSGARSIEGICEILREPTARAFCERNGFERAEGLTTVKADIAEMRDYIRRLRSRTVLPANVRLVPLSNASFEDVLRLHALYVAHQSDLDPWRPPLLKTPAMARSPVLVVNGVVAGALLWEPEGSLAIVRSRVVAPEYRGGWISAMLLGEALDVGWNNGARQAQFSYADSVHDTQKLAVRLKAEVVSVLVRSKRSIGK
jgi:GNAT superfamily N-acetyltransferase